MVAGRIAFALSCTLVALAPGQASAQVNAPDWAFGSPEAEVALTVGSVLALGTYFLPQRQSDWGPSPERPAHDGISMASDFTGSVIGASWQLVGSYGLEVSYYRDHGVDDPFGRGLRTSVIDLQAVTLATGITGAIKRLSGRCRPRAWHDGRCGPEPEYDSFPSGHVTPVAAVAGSHLLLALRSGGDSLPRHLAFGLAETASVVTAVLRVLAGAHSWEDVLAGWAIGHATGTLVALAHPMTDLAPDPGQVGAEAQPAAFAVQLGLGGSF